MITCISVKHLFRGLVCILGNSASRVLSKVPPTCSTQEVPEIGGYKALRVAGQYDDLVKDPNSASPGNVLPDFYNQIRAKQ